MIPEIKLLIDFFDGRIWNEDTQAEFTERLAETDFFAGSSSTKDKAFSGRDRINRSPKALGFIDLKPRIALTPAGREFIYGKRPHEIFLRQLLKFQLPSPYHEEGKKIRGAFCIRPYLEIFRLILDLEYLTFDELKIFVVQLTDYRNFDAIKEKILQFRTKKSSHRGKYKKFVDFVWTAEILHMYSEEILHDKIKIRESNERSLKKFVTTKKNNFRDYADACFRYLRYTETVSIFQKNYFITIAQNKCAAVDFFLSNTPRFPVHVDDKVDYKNYLFDAAEPALYADYKENLLDMLLRVGNFTKRALADKTVDELKNLYDETVNQNKIAAVEAQVAQLKSYKLYSEITELFNDIINNACYDAPLILEYNVWRAMVTLSGGKIQGNFKLDDFGEPLSTAPDNMADIECYYKNFALTVEVTLQTGARQFEAEGESVPEHCGLLRKKIGKETYHLFIAKKIHPATYAHFYKLNKCTANFYGGKSNIVPLNLSQFMKLIDKAYLSEQRPDSEDIHDFFAEVMDDCLDSKNEVKWRDKIKSCVKHWLE